MANIQVLDKHVAELIAAGEVVERPASVIKELMENSIDAGATRITVEIRDGGITYMRVTDNGCGIPRDQVPTAFLRHATSKIRTEDDLAGIGTLGFRGEALASIAAVSRVCLTTCVVGDMVGTRYEIHGGEEVSISDDGCPEGSTFEIADLFYNIPARMKFLKKDVSEGNAVAGIVERLALSHPEISFRFIRNGKSELQTTGDGNLLNCIHAVFGKVFASGLIPVDYSMGGIRVSGYVCRPDAARQNRTMQHFFINGRYVKSQTTMVALERAYKGVMMVGKFPTCVLSLEMPSETVDSNVHPAKIEVRFINEKPVFDAVYYGVKSAIECGDEIHRVLFSEEKKPIAEPPRVAPPMMPKQEVSPSTPVTPIRPTPSVRFEEKKPTATQVNAALRFLDVVVDEPSDDKMVADDSLSFVIPQPKTLEPKPIEPKAEQTVIPDKPTVRVIGEWLRTYILAELDGSLFIIDKHAAHERIIYNTLKENERVDEQMLLAPVSVNLSREEHTAVMEHIDLMAQAGMEIEDFGGSTVIVRSFPMILSGEDVDGTVREIAAGFVNGDHAVRSSKLDWIYHSSACRAATKAGDSSSMPELVSLAERVLTDEAIRYCPHGRPVCVEMTRQDIEKQFGRQ